MCPDKDVIYQYYKKQSRQLNWKWFDAWNLTNYLNRFLYTYTYIQGWKSMQFPNSEIIVEFRAKPTVH